MAPRYQRPSQTWRGGRGTVTSSDQLAATPCSPAASTTQPNGVSCSPRRLTIARSEVYPTGSLRSGHGPHPVEPDVPQSASHPCLEQQMTSDQPAPVRAELALRHRDMDALGHVNQAVYHELLEEVRAAFFRHTLPDLPFTGYVLVHVELENRLLLRDGSVAVEGRAVLVAWDEKTRRARALTEDERSALLAGDGDRG